VFGDVAVVVQTIVPIGEAVGEGRIGSWKRKFAMINDLYAVEGLCS